MDPPTAGWWQALLPVLGGAGMASYAVLSGRLLFVLLAVGSAAAAVLVTVLARLAQARRWRRRCATREARYLDHVARCREQALTVAGQQRSDALHAAPETGDLDDVIDDRHRLWCRRPGDPDAATVRLGVGRAPLAAPISLADPAHPTTVPHPRMQAAAEQVLLDAATLDDHPLAVDLARTGPLALVGDLEASAGLVRAVLVRLVLNCPPDELSVTAVTPTPAAFDWCRVLPHQVQVHDLTAGRPSGITASSAQHLLIVDGGGPGDSSLVEGFINGCTATGVQPLTLLTVRHDDPVPALVRRTATWEAGGELRIRPGVPLPGATQAVTDKPATFGLIARPDRLSVRQAQRLAQRLHPLRLAVGVAAADARTGLAAGSQLTASAPGAHADLAVTLGAFEDGSPAVLDLAESAHGGDGPHGWIVGATGTGKSELLRRLVVGLACRHPPRDLAFVLVDFKGGSAFDGLADLPHIAGVVTNLDDTDQLAGDLVPRMITALRAEVQRRQRVLRAAGANDLHSYHRDAGRPPMPRLVVVVDEAAELAGQHPEALELFANLGRVGRSLGLHLVLAAQRPDEARLRTLEGSLRFRICLRTLTTADSIAVLNDPSAAALPPSPGWARLAVDGPPRTFRVAQVEAAELDSLLGTGTTHADRQRAPVWHPPLSRRVPIGPLLAITDPPVGDDDDSRAFEPLVRPVAVGVADDPAAQWQGPLLLDLTGAAGHLAAVGAPRSGRSGLLRTFALSVAAQHSPERAHLYAVGQAGDLGCLSSLPHTGALASGDDPDLAFQVITTVAGWVQERQASKADGRPTSGPADVFLLLDDWPRLQATHPELEPLVIDIATAGLGVGVHLAITAHRWSEIRPALRDCLGTKIELHLPDPLESLLPRTVQRAAAGCPGRAVLVSGQPLRSLDRYDDLPDATADARPLLFQVADSGAASQDASAETPQTPPRTPHQAQQVAAIRGIVSRWPSSPANQAVQIAPLPLNVQQPAARRPGASRRLLVGGRAAEPSVTAAPIAIGVSHSSSRPVTLDVPGRDAHLLVIGDPGSGRSTLLGGILSAVSHRAGTETWIIDPRRKLRHAIRPANRPAHYSSSPAQIEELLGMLLGNLTHHIDGQRPPTGDTILVVDDLDLASTLTSQTHWASLAAVLPLARDLRLTLVIARRCAGMARTAYDPFMIALREAGATGLLLSGDPDEGPLINGIRARKAPPGRAQLIRRARPPITVQIYRDLGSGAPALPQEPPMAAAAG